MSLISLYVCSRAMCCLMTALELCSADCRISSSLRGSPEVFDVRPEGSWAWVASVWRWALRSVRVCVRVALRASRAVRRGLEVVVVVFGFWLFGVVFSEGPMLSEDGGAVVGFDGVDGWPGWDDMVGFVKSRLASTPLP